MIIDCDRCAVRGDACQDCVIGVLLRAPETASDPGSDRRSETGSETGSETRPADHTADLTTVEGPSGASVVQLDAPERRALEVLADQGLVPRLRLVATPSRHDRHQSGHPAAKRDAG